MERMDELNAGITVTPDKASMLEVTGYIEEMLDKNSVPMKLCSKMGIATDEVWSNVVYYSGATVGKVNCRVDNGKIIARFSDNGTPFNPLDKEDPDVEAALDEREIGGLGIFMTKKLMTNVDYAYTDGWNSITLTLDIK